MSLGVKEFLDLIDKKLTEIGDEVILIKPNATSVFPCRQINTPLKSVNKTNALETFQISIKHWNESQEKAMEMADKTDLKLLEHNLVRTSTTQSVFNEELQKYEHMTTYEVKYNVLTNAFQLVK